jgi:hypothetical protein
LLSCFVLSPFCVDGALVFVFKDIEKSFSYIPGTYSYTPAAGMYGFRGYYGGMYNYLYGGLIIKHLDIMCKI